MFHKRILTKDKELEINENKEGLEEINVIKNLHKRKNEFIRPMISNIDIVFLITSIKLERCGQMVQLSITCINWILS